MKSRGQSWRSDFPMREEVEDYAGRRRAFIIECHERELGFTVVATEDGRGGLGYEFASFSETSPYSALCRVRQKMHRGLAIRHLTGFPGGYGMLHDRLTGRIAARRETGVFLVVDGVPLTIENLAEILSTHEGWGFELQIVDALD